jgi:hypothetical protein
VHYSISSNEDIFELIKYDLLIDLINNYGDKLSLTREDFSILFSAQMFMLSKAKLTSLLYPLMEVSGKIGKPIIELIKAIESIGKDFESYRKEIEEDEGKLILDYLKKSKERSGSSYEMDAVSRLIVKLIDRLKKSVAGQENIQSILVIDDLDRLDPEHIFRLFNVFSAHYDLNDNNKFGFDKVIFVCDIENIRKIYHYRYGQDVDFNGYIDKFYSKNVFDFNNRELIKEFVASLIETVPYEEISYEKKYPLKGRSLFYWVFEWIILALLDAKELNLRMLIQYHSITVPSHTFSIRGVRRELNADSYTFIVLIYLLKSFYPSFEVLELKLKRLKDVFKKGFISNDKYHFNDVENIEHGIVSYCLPFIVEEGMAFDEDFMYKHRDEAQEYFLMSKKAVIQFRYMQYDGFKYFLWVNKITHKDASEEIHLEVFDLLYETFMKCKEKGIFK